MEERLSPTSQRGGRSKGLRQSDETGFSWGFKAITGLFGQRRTWDHLQDVQRRAEQQPCKLYGHVKAVESALQRAWVDAFYRRDSSLMMIFNLTIIILLIKKITNFHKVSTPLHSSSSSTALFFYLGRSSQKTWNGAFLNFARSSSSFSKRESFIRIE